jgi:hypothetical protein
LVLSEDLESLNQGQAEPSYSIFVFNCHFVGSKLKAKEQIEELLAVMKLVQMGLSLETLGLGFVDNLEVVVQKAFSIFPTTCLEFLLEVAINLVTCFVFAIVLVKVLTEQMGSHLLEFYVRKISYLY